MGLGSNNILRTQHTNYSESCIVNKPIKNTKYLIINRLFLNIDVFWLVNDLQQRKLVGFKMMQGRNGYKILGDYG